jgi:hypothetical protein
MTPKRQRDPHTLRAVARELSDFAKYYVSDGATREQLMHKADIYREQAKKLEARNGK